MNTKRIYSLCFLLLITLAGCIDFDELNTDPDNPTDLDPDLLIPTIQFYPGAEWQEQQRYFIYPGGFMNQWTGAYAIVEYGGCGQQHNNYQERLWTTYYPEGINYATDVIQRTRNTPDKINLYSMARILRVQLALRLTDYYGDIPYSEAGLGYYDNNLKPQYDTQESIYHDFLKELKEAGAAFDASYPSSQYDLFYNGDLDKWRKYANSLRLRIAMRLVKVEPETARQEAEDAVHCGVFTSNEDICLIKYENVQNSSFGKGKGNGIANYLYGNVTANGSEIWLTTELIKLLEDSEDPRLLLYSGVFLNDDARTEVTSLVRAKRSSYAAMATPAQRYNYSANPDYPNDNGAVKITVGGKEQELALKNARLRPSKYLTAFDSPYIYISYAEVEFLIAEAAARKWDVNGDAQSHYNKAIPAAIKQWELFGATVTDNQVNTYLTKNPFDIDNAIEQINTQLWIHHILDPMETWANWRRSGYPKLIFHNYEPGKNQSNGTFPRRMIYPIDEQLKNSANYREAVSRIGEDNWTKRVWWDKE